MPPSPGCSLEQRPDGGKHCCIVGLTGHFGYMLDIADGVSVIDDDVDLDQGLWPFIVVVMSTGFLIGFRPETVLFRLGGVYLRACLCGVQ